MLRFKNPQLVFKRKKSTKCSLLFLKSIENRQTSNFVTKIKTLGSIDIFWYLKPYFKCEKIILKIWGSKLMLNREYSQKFLKRKNYVWKFNNVECLAVKYVVIGKMKTKKNRHSSVTSNLSSLLNACFLLTGSKCFEKISASRRRKIFLKILVSTVI